MPTKETKNAKKESTKAVKKTSNAKTDKKQKASGKEVKPKTIKKETKTPKKEVKAKAVKGKAKTPKKEVKTSSKKSSTPSNSKTKKSTKTLKEKIIEIIPKKEKEAILVEKPENTLTPKAKKTVSKTKKTNTKAKVNSLPSKKTTKKKTALNKKDESNTVEYYDLPNKYNKTMVKILFQTPKKLFVYWEISEDDRLKLISENGNEFFQNTTPFLIVTNTTKNYSFEIQINDFANSWYFDVPDSNSNYSVELIRKDNLTYAETPIETSNNLEVPNNHILFEQNRFEVFFKNIKTNAITSKKIANLQFINHLGVAQPATLNAFYNKFYDEKDLYSTNNTSSYS